MAARVLLSLVKHFVGFNLLPFWQNKSSSVIRLKRANQAIWSFCLHCFKPVIHDLLNFDYITRIRFCSAMLTKRCWNIILSFFLSLSISLYLVSLTIIYQMRISRSTNYNFWVIYIPRHTNTYPTHLKDLGIYHLRMYQYYIVIICLIITS